MRPFQRFAAVTLGATLVLVTLGGAVRATDSGLACPDWPRCFGMWIPPANVHIWLEHSHRLLAGVVGLMVGALLLWALLRYRQRPMLVWTAAAAVVLIVLQSALGALVVLRLLQAELVTAHLGMAMLVVACLALLVSASRGRQPSPAERARRDLRFAHAATAVAGLCLLQILVGGHVTGIAAGLVWTDFPLMGGELLPELATEREAYHFAHRVLAVMLVAAVAWLCWEAARLRRGLGAAAREPAQRRLLRLPWWALGLTLGQVALGVANLWTAAAAPVVIAHLAVASGIWTVLVFAALLAYRDAPARPAPATASEPDVKPEVLA